MGVEKKGYFTINKTKKKIKHSKKLKKKRIEKKHHKKMINSNEAKIYLFRMFRWR